MQQSPSLSCSVYRIKIPVFKSIKLTCPKHVLFTEIKIKRKIKDCVNHPLILHLVQNSFLIVTDQMGADCMHTKSAPAPVCVECCFFQFPGHFIIGTKALFNHHLRNRTKQSMVTVASVRPIVTLEGIFLPVHEWTPVLLTVTDTRGFKFKN